jgi:hypothetical protein
MVRGVEPDMLVANGLPSFGQLVRIGQLVLATRTPPQCDTGPHGHIESPAATLCQVLRAI